ncbi:MAG TPA: hypothetical protein VFC41_06775 [Anaerovoracaceae bacterium]|nr:hypothetical protein [Anaerovoracaceae bacterium]
MASNLPVTIGKDIEMEIRSLIEDRIADRCHEAGVSDMNEEMVKEVLLELGPPEKVAAGYLPDRYLIGPRNYPLFVRVFKLVLFAQVLGFSVAYLVQVFTQKMPESGAVNFLMEMGFGLIQGILIAFGSVTLIFAIIEWAQRKADVQLTLWTPQYLFKPAPKKVARAGKVWEVLLYSAFLVVFNIYPNWLGFSNYSDGHWINVPLLSQNFIQYLPILNLFWLVNIMLALNLVVRGNWENWSEWVNVFIRLLRMVIAILFISSGPLLAANIVNLNATGWTQEFINTFQTTVLPILNIQLKVLFCIILVVEGIELIRWGLARFKSGLPTLEFKR